jgi:hypothetical protein
MMDAVAMEGDTKYLIDLNKENLARAIAFGGVMDSKAKFVLTLVLALTAYLVSQLGGYVEAHARWMSMPGWAPTFFVILDILVLACLFFFTTAAIMVIHTITPRLDQHSGRPSPLFFATIAQIGIEDFKAAMRTIPPNQASELLAEQTYDNAKIIARKCSYVQKSIRMFYWGMASFLVFTIGRPIVLALTAR